MIEKDLNTLRKLLQEYAKDTLSEGCEKDDMELVSYANKIKNTALIIGEVEYIRRTKGKTK